MPKKSWRDVVEIHPCASVFPGASSEDLKEMKRSIRATTLREGVILWTQGNKEWLLDGRTRLDALEQLGHEVIKDGVIKKEWVKEAVDSLSSFGPAQYVIAANIRRRHLTPAQRATLAVAAITAEKSMRKGTIAAPAAIVPGEQGGAPRQKGVSGSVKGDVAKLAEAAGVSKDTALRAIRKANGKAAAPSRPRRVVASFADYILKLTLSKLSGDERLLLAQIRDRITEVLGGVK